MSFFSKIKDFGSHSLVSDIPPLIRRWPREPVFPHQFRKSACAHDLFAVVKAHIVGMDKYTVPASRPQTRWKGVRPFTQGCQIGVKPPETQL